MLVGLNREGKPWQWIDGRIDIASPEFKWAYQLWRQSEIRAGNDPKVTAIEYAAITKLHDIRTAIEKFRSTHNNRPPTMRAIAALPANPFTGLKSVTRSGQATKVHGWSYDEAAGKIRIVLPPKKYAGLHPGEIEWPRISK